LRRYYGGNLTSSDQLMAGASSVIAHLEVFSLKLSGNMREGESIIAQGVDGKVGRCRLTLSKPVFKAPMVSALEATI
jgi:hypothetical protein